MQNAPAFWKTDLETIESWAKKAHRAQTWSLCKSAGGRDVWAFAYGGKQEFTHRANYSSACGAHDKSCYAPVEGKKPVVALLGAVHGGETEGTAALVNLISLMETGKDLRGDAYPSLVEAAEGVRLVIVPVCNADGRARVQPASMIGCTGYELRYWMQGTWKDGSLCGWPECKKQHPIRDYVDFLGGYYNDDGVNLMHDNFFHPMARETQALLDLCDAEAADWVIQMHGGSNSVNDLLQPDYVTLECQQAVRSLAIRCNEVAGAQGLAFHVRDLPGREQGATPPSFNLTSALHHVCGAVSATFESNQCVVDEPGTHYTCEQVYASHRILFEQLLRTVRGE